jgi:hypothetical protein
MVGLISAAGLVGFLSEPDPELKVFALKQLDSQVDLLWTEIANSVGQMYELPPILLKYTDKRSSLVRHFTRMNRFLSVSSQRSSPQKSITICKNTTKAWHLPW